MAYPLVEIARCQSFRWALLRFWQELRIKSGALERKLPRGLWPDPSPFQFPDLRLTPENLLFPSPVRDAARTKADSVLAGQIEFFSKGKSECGFPPDWFGAEVEGRQKETKRTRTDHWSRIPDFDGGDIKKTWETSRFSWAFPLVRAYEATKDDRYAEAFWRAVESWRQANPPNTGVHWKCGQEIAIRAIAWVFALYGLRSSAATSQGRRTMLAGMLEVFGERIEGNIGYALSQKNNHGVSEAVGLYTIGCLLGREQWVKRGSTLLDGLADELIYDDGSFAQHSTNYHRLVLHLYLWCLWLGENAGRPFKAATVGRVSKAGKWLLAMVDPTSGRVPNLGPNDGAHLFQLTDLDYLDYRPTVQAVGWITERRRWLPPGPWDELAAWLGGMTNGVGDNFELPENVGLQMFSVGGYAIWRRPSMMALLRCPARFQHRPAHADLLHFDLWHCGRNLLRDSGSYSYNCEPSWEDYFPSVSAHNTVQFDDHDQMPKLSRFLYGRWPRTEVRTEADDTVTAAYKDWTGCRHLRRVEMRNKRILVTDELSGYSQGAVQRWRLDPGLKWEITDSRCASKVARLSVRGSVPVIVGLGEGWESLYYGQKSRVPVLETRVGPSRAKITTEIDLTES